MVGIMIIFNDLVWWIPFGGILALAWRTRGGMIGARA